MYMYYKYRAKSSLIPTEMSPKFYFNFSVNKMYFFKHVLSTATLCINYSTWKRLTMAGQKHR